MNYQGCIDKVLAQMADFQDTGKVATYIPELGHVDPNKFGVHLTTVDGQHFSTGDAQEEFSIQSVAKVLALTMAYDQIGESIWERVGVEPSGTSFNSLLVLERNEGIPRNPLVNAGAIVICDILMGHLSSPKEELLAFIQTLSSDETIYYCEKTALSEKRT